MVFSIIIPTINSAQSISHTIEAWVNQALDRTKYEIIIVGNNCKDETKQIQDIFHFSRCKLNYLFEKVPGATNARHRGAKEAKGDILVFADDDGIVNPGCLEEILKVYEQNPNAEAVACKIDVQWDGEEPDWISPYKFMLGQLDYGDEVSYSTKYWMNGGLMSVKKETFERLGGFNPDLIGEHLIGDGDTGFVRKLHDEGILIGWAPKAHMYHMQQVAKHGSIKGIARHFYNNGIANSYALYRKEDFHFSPRVIRYFVLHCLLLIKKIGQYHILHKKDKEHYFSLCSRKGELKFFINLLNPELRKMIKQKNVYSAS